MKKTLFLLLPLFFIACEDDLGDVGKDLLPDGDNLVVMVDDSSTFESSYQRDDIVRSRAGTIMLGQYEDAVFGKQTANIVSRFYYDPYTFVSIIGDGYYMKGADTIPISIDSIMIDTAILQLVIDENYMIGDTSVNQSFNVYELTKDLEVSDYSDYYTSGIIPEDNISSSNTILIGSTTQVVSAKNNFLQIELNSDFIKRLRNAIVVSYSEMVRNDSIAKWNYTDSSATIQQTFLNDVIDKKFIEAFKGLYIETVSGLLIARYKSPQIILKYKTHVGGSKFEANFKTATSSFYDDYDDRDDDLTYIYPLTFFERDGLLLDANATKPNRDTVYICGGLAYSSVIKFLDLDRWLNEDSIIFNNAELTIPYDPIINSEFPLPQNLLLTCSNNNYKVDFNGDEGYYENSWSATLDTYNSVYRVSITDFLYHFNDFYDQKNTVSISDFTFTLSDPTNFDDIDRVILDCGKNSQNLKLKIVYTKF